MDRGSTNLLYNSMDNMIEELGITPVTARELISRGHDNPEEARKFLYPKFSHLRTPFEFPDMQFAVNRILTAITQKEQILVWGHNDVDGITATALLVKVICDLGGVVNWYNPPRRRITHLLPKDITLIITVDCTPGEKYHLPNFTEGTDIIITDHHELPRGKPVSFAFINPKVGYKFPWLAGVGVAYKIAQALTMQKLKITPLQWFSVTRNLLPLVLLGTLADRVALTDENRTFVKLGQEAVKGTIFDNIGINESIKLLASTKANPNVGVEFLLSALCKDGDTTSLLFKLEEMRVEQGNKIEEMYGLCLQLKSKLGGFVFVYGDKLAPDIIGVCASRLLERDGVPSIVIGRDTDGLLVGEARVPNGFDLIELFKRVDDIFVDWGGHRGAAGFSMAPDKLNEFKSRLHELIFDASFLSPAPPIMEVKLEEITSEFLHEMKLFEPFGSGNPPPLFLTHMSEGKVACQNDFSALIRHKLPLPIDDEFDVIWSVEQGHPIIKKWNKV